MGALAALRFDPEMRAYYDRLVARGKARKQALCALMHKLLRRMTGKLRDHYAAARARPITAAA